jgi:isocitrate dehydrogenase (NAD+)
MLGAAQMLSHLDREESARKLRSAIRQTLAAGDRVTPDVGGEGSTESMTDAIIERL